MLVMEKLAHDLPQLLYDDVIFSHTIDEVLLFERELHATHGYPPTLPGCLDLLTTPEPLSKWLAVEKKCQYFLFAILLYVRIITLFVITGIAAANDSASSTATSTAAIFGLQGTPDCTAHSNNFL